ncbi:MAG: choice-of-anchor Q domain-containing protein [Nitrospirales bacterium]
MKPSHLQQTFHFPLLTIIILWSTLLGGCTYRVNNMIDQPDANPGDFRCEIAVNGGPEVITTNAGRCTLRAAIEEANATIVEDTIEIPPGVYPLNLPSNQGGGRLQVTEDVVIQGSGATVTAVDGVHETRILRIGTSDDSADVKISGLTIQNGRGGSSMSGGGITITEGSTLELTDSIVRDNETSAPGGGIANDGSLYLFRSTVRDNKIPNDSTVETPPQGGGGGTQHSGAGIMNFSGADLTIENSTITGNFTTRGGGIRNAGGTMEIRNSTISSNIARIRGGGVMNFGDADISFTTITDNQARSAPGDVGSETHGGGGIFNEGDITMANSILSENTDNENSSDYSPDCRTDTPNEPGSSPGQISSLGGNIVGVLTSDCNFETNSDLSGTENNPLDPNLNLLSNWGGTTRTHRPQLDSPAIDHGTGFGGCPTTDQRGYIRPVDGNENGNAVCDTGSVERGAVPLLLPTTEVEASSHEPPNIPTNIIDTNLTSRWAANGIDEYISINLGSIRVISSISLAWYRGDQRSARFFIQSSMDNDHWTTIGDPNVPRESSGGTLNLEEYNFQDQAGQYVRIVGQGNDENDWISITEAEIRGGL